jgi:hypothetical protein
MFIHPQAHDANPFPQRNGLVHGAVQAKAADWLAIIADANSLAAKLILLKQQFPVSTGAYTACFEGNSRCNNRWLHQQGYVVGQVLGPLLFVHPSRAT